MFYRGKYGDTFEAALQMQLINHNLERLHNLDVISLRCCHYVFREENWQECICSAIPIGMAIERINKVCFKKGGFQYMIPKDFEEFGVQLQEGDVICPVRSEKIHYDMRTVCFSGQTQFLYYCGERDKLHKWHCAYQYPFLIKTVNEVWEENTGIIRLRKESEINEVTNNIKIRSDCLQYIATQNLRGKDMLPEHLVSGVKRKQIIALQMGLNNYLLQLNKLINFVGKYSDQIMRESEVIFTELYEKIVHLDVIGFNNKNRELYSLLQMSICEE